MTVQNRGRDALRYDQMLQRALRGVLREALSEVAARGLPGDHHLYITFRTGAAGVELPDYLKTRFPDEMTIVLQHEFWGLEVEEVSFGVTLSFSGRSERLTIPFSAVIAFADPSVRFGLQFEPSAADKGGADKTGAPTVTEGESAPLSGQDSGEAKEEAADGEEDDTEDAKVVTLDRFRKK